MRLLFLNRSFWPDLEATGQLLTELCSDLAEEHEVEVICGPSYHVRTNGRGLWRRDAFGRVGIVRTWGTRLAKQRLAARLVNLATYYGLAAAAAWRGARPDVVVAETDPPLLGLLGALLRRHWGCRFVYYCQDLYPDVAAATGALRSPSLLRLLAASNRRAYAAADAIVVLGEDMRRRLIEKGVAADKIEVVPNWTDCAAIRAVEPNPFRERLGADFVVMYAGNLGLTQALERLLDAARDLREETRIRFVLVGEGAAKAALQARAAREGLENVCFVPYQPKERLAEVLSAADLHVIPLRPGLQGCLVPSKVYPVLAAGRPFVAMMEESAEVARLAEERGVGFVVGPNDERRLAAVVGAAAGDREMLRAMGERARRLAEEEFDRRILTRRFGRLLRERCGPR